MTVVDCDDPAAPTEVVVVEREPKSGGVFSSVPFALLSLAVSPIMFLATLYFSDQARKAYDRLCEALSDRQATLDYLGILHLAAHNGEARIETALEALAAKVGSPQRRAFK